MGEALSGNGRARRRRRTDPAYALLIALAGTPAQGPTTVRVGEVTAVAWAPDVRLASALAREAARPVDWPGLGRVPLGPLRLIVVPNRGTLDSLIGGRTPDWTAALALPDEGTIVVRADAGDPSRLLRHELAHLALHRRIAGRVPRWFDEGYAGWAAGEWERLGGLTLNLAVARGAVPDFTALDAALQAAEPSAGAAYALAMSAVLELARRNPTGTLAPLLDRLAAAEPFDAAVLATTGLSVGRFEEAWQREVRSRYTIVTWLAAGGLWAVLAVAVLLLVRWRRRQDRARRAALNEGWPLPPDDDLASPGEDWELDRRPGGE